MLMLTLGLLVRSTQLPLVKKRLCKMLFIKESALKIKPFEMVMRLIVYILYREAPKQISHFYCLLGRLHN